MNQNQRNNVVKSLVDFITRVSAGNTTCEAEVEVLPQVVKALVEIMVRL